MNTQVGRASEKWIEKALQDFVTGHGGTAIKLSDPVKNGLPDRLVLWPGGVTEFVELKSTGKKPGPMQRLVRDEILKLGFRYTVIDTETKLKQWQNLYHEHIKGL